MRREPVPMGSAPRPEERDTDLTSWDLRLGSKNERLTPNLRIERDIDWPLGPPSHQVGHLPALVALLKRNIDVFAWAPSDMSCINTRVMYHRLSIDPTVKPISQRKREVDDENG